MIEFLLEYYVWILAVLGIIIITVIGFLVDSNRRNKKKEIQGSNKTEVKTVEPLPEINSQNAVPIIDSTNQSTQILSSNVIESNPNLAENQVQGIQPISTNINTNQSNNANQEITLNEQKPYFDSKEVPMPNQVPVNNENMILGPKPVNAVPINHNVVQPVLQQTQTVSPTVTNDQNINSMNGLNNIRPTMQSFQNNQMTAQNMMGYNNMNINNQTMAYQNTPVQAPTPRIQQPVGIITNVPASQNVTMPIQNPQAAVVSEPVQSESNTSMPNIGINFVTGTQNEQNTNDDTWNL